MAKNHQDITVREYVKQLQDAAECTGVCGNDKDAVSGTSETITCPGCRKVTQRYTTCCDCGFSVCEQCECACPSFCGVCGKEGDIRSLGMCMACGKGVCDCCFCPCFVAEAREGAQNSLVQ